MNNCRVLLTQLFVFFLFLGHTTSGQEIIRVSLNDTVELNFENVDASLQWETSTDGVNWSDIPGENTNFLSIAVNQEITYLRMRIEQPECDPSYSEVILLEVQETFLWSDPQTWGDTGIPEEGDTVVIPENKHIILDVSPPQLSGLTIDGTLEFDEQDLELSSEWIVVHGTLRIGYEDNLFTHNATITLTDTDTGESIMNMGTRGIMVMGGNLELHGSTPNLLHTKINQHANQGDTLLSLIDNPDWLVDDQIIIAPTDYYEAGLTNNSVTQLVNISNINNNEITINEGLNAFRWGLLQYPTPNGISLSDADVVNPPMPNDADNNTPLVLDERA